MTNARVNKFLYFAQGHCLARHGTVLFDDDIEAWRYGPVIRDVYDRFRIYEKNPIQSISEEYSLDMFTSEQLTLLNDVISKYNRYSTGNLINISHIQNSPWYKAYSEGLNHTIDNDDMCSWFENIELPNSILEMITKRGTAGYRDSEGYLVLPKDYE